ncbi:DgyrCDS7349 [Dimorphilus gyrociliatus]|uniref:DgyrCDS7349 n=1 Tax=Dimorphilus gyrociliatus TaxID=2664684 RepID=A0A7I8VT09_9ANNE|nr:DgyrCDS7349 [Dimorphilus gyrociliatus]
MEGIGVRQRLKEEKIDETATPHQLNETNILDFNKLPNIDNCHLKTGKDEKFETMTEYATALQKWMVQYSAWCMFQSIALAPNTNTSNREQKATSQSQTQPNQSQPEQPPTIQEREFLVPSLWKRVTAEFIDFLLLFIVKLTVTMYIVEQLELVNLDNLDLDTILNDKLDYDKAVNMTWELVAIELINRIFISIFETLCLRKGIIEMGGATPGKRMMGLVVVSCDSAIAVNNNVIRVRPASDIGFKK